MKARLVRAFSHGSGVAMTLDELASPVWWTTAVIGSIALKVVADYVRKGIDMLLSKSTSIWSARSRATQEKFEKRVNELKSSKELRDSAFRREIRLRLISIYLMLVAILGFLLIMFLDSTLADKYVDASRRSVWLIDGKPSNIFVAITNAIEALGIVVVAGMSITANEKAAYVMRTIIAANKARLTPPSDPLKSEDTE
ncbi:hypothetical protein ACVCIH_05995 [Burkholderia glumae]|uniref:hypothetical protein n=1 Tax=Burkholderia glumae TaxID=337 RepID=UPI0020367E8E|nr:hypothetical protein [Burkholderia glumae]MCM2492710.1 hypothetical protein [Burkholderia glumae]